MKTRLISATLALITVCLFSSQTAQAGPNGTYKGMSDEQVKVKVKVKKNRIVDFETSVYASCGFENYLITFAFPAAHQPRKSARIKGNGSFKVVFGGSSIASFNDDKRTLKGKFKGGSISGSLKVEGLCSADATFTAKR